MTLIDAIKSGRPWRPKGADKWREPLVRGPGYNEVRFELGELDAEFEIQAPTVTITRTQLFSAYEEAFKDFESSRLGQEITVYTYGMCDRIARKLGLEGP